MRDKRYVAVHRGGPLSLEHHRMLAVWAAACAEHVLPMFTEQRPNDKRPWKAIEVARAWSRGDITVGEARSAAVAAHAAAREAGDGAACYVARAAGHAVATAHMADHAPGVVMYAIKATNAAGGDVDQELAWQVAQLPRAIKALVISTLRDTYHIRLNEMNSKKEWTHGEIE